MTSKVVVVALCGWWATWLLVPGQALVSPWSPSVAFHSKRTRSFGSSSTALNLLGRFRRKKKIEIPQQIEIGSPLPEVDVELATRPSSSSLEKSRAIVIQEVFQSSGSSDSDGDNNSDRSSSSSSSSNTHMLIGMPGAYTPTCTDVHIPGLKESFPKFQALGVETIAVMTTNDRFVNEAWAKSLGIIMDASLDEKKKKEGGTVDGGGNNDSIVLLSDADAELATALGLAEDMGFGMGVRSKRFAMILKDGLVSHLEVDDGIEECDNTSADRLLQVLAPPGSLSDVDSEGTSSNQMAMLGAIALLVIVGASMTMGGHDVVSSSSSSHGGLFGGTTPSSSGFDLLKSYGGSQY